MNQSARIKPISIYISYQLKGALYTQVSFMQSFHNLYLRIVFLSLQER